MSLEEQLSVASVAITKLTAALTALTAAGGLPTVAEEAAPAAVAEVKKGKGTKPHTAASKITASAAESPVVPDYDKQVAPAVLALSKAKGRDAVIALLTEFGVENTKDVGPERYQAIMDEAIKRAKVTDEPEEAAEEESLV